MVSPELTPATRLWRAANTSLVHSSVLDTLRVAVLIPLQLSLVVFGVACLTSLALLYFGACDWSTCRWVFVPSACMVVLLSFSLGYVQALRSDARRSFLTGGILLARGDFEEAGLDALERVHEATNKSIQGILSVCPGLVFTFLAVRAVDYYDQAMGPISTVRALQDSGVFLDTGLLQQSVQVAEAAHRRKCPEAKDNLSPEPWFARAREAGPHDF